MEKKRVRGIGELIEREFGKREFQSLIDAPEKRIRFEMSEIESCMFIDISKFEKSIRTFERLYFGIMFELWDCKPNLDEEECMTLSVCDKFWLCRKI